MTGGKFLRDEANGVCIEISCDEVNKTVLMKVESTTGRVTVTFENAKELDMLEDAIRDARFDLKQMLKPTPAQTVDDIDAEFLALTEIKEVTNG